MNRILAIAVSILLSPMAANAQSAPSVTTACGEGRVVADRNANGRADPGERGLAGVRVSDGVELVSTDAAGRFSMQPVPGRTWFVVKPPGWAVPRGADGMPSFWRHVPRGDAPSLQYGGIRNADAGCPVFLLQPGAGGRGPLDVLVFADPQTKSERDVGYYARDIVDPLRDAGPAAQLGLSLGDIVDDDLSLYPQINAVTARLGLPWLHAAGNHDLDMDAATDADSLQTFRHHFGPDTLAWEEANATFIVLDDVIHRPGERPAYIGGLREDQFVFLERYLASVDPARLLVLALHIPLFDEPGRETFRAVDRARLFELLERFPHRLVLSGHGHVQRHVFHAADAGWRGATPLHEYNVGAACGAFWSGVASADGVPDSTMADGTPNGYARLRVEPAGRYALTWHPARLESAADMTPAMALHAPRVLRRGAYPAWAVYANVFMGQAGTRVEYRVGDGAWKAMTRVERADPRLLAENVRDDEAVALRGFDRSPEAQPSTHLWRGALPTHLAVGQHRIEVRAFDPWRGEQRATTAYALHDPVP